MDTPLRLVPKLITVNRYLFRAQVWRMKGNQYVKGKRYVIAVGRDGYRTPPGMYFITRKDLNPTWYPPPDADWVTPAMRDENGVPFPLGPDDPRNPLRGAFLALSGDDAIGFHGVPESEYDTIGQRASHGCLRMTVEDVLDLNGRVSLGTPVFIY